MNRGPQAVFATAEARRPLAGPSAPSATLILLHDLASPLCPQELPGCERLQILVAPFGSFREETTSSFDPSFGSAAIRVLPRTESCNAAILGATEQAESDCLLLAFSDEKLSRHSLSLLQTASREADVAISQAPHPSSDLLTRITGLCVAGLYRILGVPVCPMGGGMIALSRHTLWTLAPQSHSRFALPELVAAAQIQGQKIQSLGVASCEEVPAPPRIPTAQTRATAVDALRFAWNQIAFPGRVVFGRTEPVRLWLRVTCLLLLASGVFCSGLNAPLTEPDEGRHAEIAREMWVSGDWLAPQFLHQPYLDKPPLLYWLCSASFQLFGVEAWAARLPPALWAIATVLVTYVLGRRLLNEDSAWKGALVLTLSLGFVACGRFLILESVLTTFVVTSLLCGRIAMTASGAPYRWWLASAAACGLGVLTKGPVALVLVIPPLYASRWLTPPSGSVRKLRWMAYLAVVTAVAAPWYCAVMIVRPEFLRYFFWEHNVGRFLTGADHVEPFWFYLPVLLISLLPWSGALIGMLRGLIATHPAQRALRTPELGFLVLWSGWEFAFFSTSAGKLPYYIVSSLPALSLLIGDFLSRIEPAREHEHARDEVVRTWTWRLPRATLLMCAAGLVIGPVLGGMQLLGWATALTLAAVWLAALLILRSQQGQWLPRTQWRVYCAVALGNVLMLTHLALSGWQQRYAVLTPAQIEQQGLSDTSTRLACIGGEWGSIPFYTGRNDVRYFDTVDRAILQSLLKGVSEVRLLVRRTVPIKDVERSLPPNVCLTQLLSTRRAVLLNIEDRQRARRTATSVVEKLHQSL